VIVMLWLEAEPMLYPSVSIRVTMKEGIRLRSVFHAVMTGAVGADCSGHCGVGLRPLMCLVSPKAAARRRHTPTSKPS